MITQNKDTINANILHSPQYQKALREYHQARPSFADRLELQGNSLQNYRKSKVKTRQQLNEAKQQLADDQFEGNKHAVMMTDLRQETEEMRELLSAVTSIERVEVQERIPTVDWSDGYARETFKVNKVMVPLREYAEKQAFALDCCSRKTIYQFHTDSKKLEFKYTQRCGRRTCSVCGHFDALAERRLLIDELKRQFDGMEPDKLLSGRLVHLVFTHENVPVDRVFEIMDVWRTIQKQKKKKRDNIHSVWAGLDWGLYRWEVTRNEKTGMYHPHLHVLCWTDRWLAPERGGDWDGIVRSWIEACKNKGLHATWEAQHMGHVFHFTKETAEELNDGEFEKCLTDDASEMAKYPVKSTDFTKIMKKKNGEIDSNLANEIAMLFYLMHGRRIKNGFGGFNLREVKEEDMEQMQELEEETGDEEPSYEMIFEWDKHQKRYVLLTVREWSDARFTGFLMDLQDWREKNTVLMLYGLEAS